MPAIKENEIYKIAKLPSFGSEQPVYNRQNIDAIKHINKQVGILQGKIRDLEERKLETFKYIKGTHVDNRTVPNQNGEVKFESSNKTIGIKTNGETIDLKLESVGSLSGAFVTTNGLTPLVGNWGAGGFKITAETFESDIATGTAPLAVASTTLCTNLNADLWDGYEFADYLDQAVKTGSIPTLAGLLMPDNGYLKCGSSGDAGCYYDNTNWIFNPKIVGSGVMLADTNSKWCFRDTAIGIYSQADGYGDMFSDTAWRIGDSSAGAPTNYLKINPTGDLSFSGTARIDWNETLADSVTLVAGTLIAGNVNSVKYANDGVIYHIREAAATPGIDFIVDFVSVTAINWIRILAYYDGSSSHSITIQLYNWNNTLWEIFDSQNGIENTMTNHSFFIPSDTYYIGTGGNAGKVRVRFNHTQSGNASHHLYIDAVILYQ